MNKFYDPNDAANWLKKGKILIHPTEGVWGIGCDAFNAAAVKKINSLKQREASKSLILLASSISDALRYFQPLSEQKIKFLETVWPGHITVIYNKNKLSNINGELRPGIVHRICLLYTSPSPRD